MRTALSAFRPQGLSRSLAAAGVAVAAAAVLAGSAGAQGRWGRTGGPYDSTYGGSDRSGARSLYAWSGRVDREAYVVMQSGDVRTRADGNGYGDGRVRVASDLPRAEGVVDVRLAEGRGRVDVIEQPSRRNNYRVVVRVRDDDAGAGYYRFATTWRPVDGGAYGGTYDPRRGDDDGRYGDGRSGDERDDRRGRGRGRWGRGEGDDRRDGDRHDGDRHDGDRRRGDDDGRDGTDGVYGGAAGGTYGGSGALHWRGRVDDVAEIRVQGGRVDTRTVSGRGAADVRAQLQGGALPARDVTVRVSDRSGRGRVSVVQQPHAWNGYTAVVRVEDRDAGAGYYDLDLTW